MRFSFKNLGIVEEANIEINGLTILTGLNDTGKSFISKAIYSIVKAFNESVSHIDRKRLNSVNLLINQINLSHRQIVPFTQEKVQKFNPASIVNKALDYFVNKSITKEEFKLIIDSYKDQIISDIQTTLKNEAPGIQQRISLINQNHKSIISNLQDTSDEEKFKMYYDEEIIQKLFQAQITSIGDEKQAMSADVYEGATKILSFNVLQNKTNITESNSSISIALKNVTILETPIIVNLERYITFSLAYAQPQGVDLPIHYVDLCRKISISNASTKISDSILGINERVKEIIGGQIVFNADQGGTIFVKNNGAKIRVNNIATGIKSFGLLQILINSGAINEYSLLIIDEPEVHVHLKWQLLYAEMIVALMAIGVPIIISTHSPFFLEALTVYVSQYKKVNEVTVYNAERNETTGKTIFKNVTQNLGQIFDQLSEPIAKLQMINE